MWTKGEIKAFLTYVVIYTTLLGIPLGIGFTLTGCAVVRCAAHSTNCN